MNSSQETSGAKIRVDRRVPCSLDEIPIKLEIPEDTVCVFASGSLVSGWGHSASDVDLYIVSGSPAAITSTTTTNRGFNGQQFPLVIAYSSDAVRYDIEYWTVGQVGALLEVVSGPGDRDLERADRFGYSEIDCFFRLSIGVALTGDAWLHAIKERINKSNLSVVLARVEFDEADSLAEDAAGMLSAGDQHSALLAAKMAFGHAVDGYLFGRGSFSPAAKWRYRKLSELPDTALSPDIFWDLETMKDLDPNDVRPWIEQVLRTCQCLTMEVDLS